VNSSDGWQRETPTAVGSKISVSRNQLHVLRNALGTREYFGEKASQSSKTVLRKRRRCVGVLRGEGGWYRGFPGKQCCLGKGLPEEQVRVWLS